MPGSSGLAALLPTAALIAWAIRRAVVRSGLRSEILIDVRLDSSNPSSRSTMAPAEIRPVGRRIWALGLGFGLQKSWRRTFLSLDLNQYRISRDLDDKYSVRIDVSPPTVDLGLGKPDIDNHLTRIKLQAGLVLLSGTSLLHTPFFTGTSLSLFGGVSLNQLWTDGNPRLIEPQGGYQEEWEDDLFFWPGFFFGLRYGR